MTAVRALEAMMDDVNREIGDIEPGPERDAKFREVIVRRLESATNDTEKLFWRSMLKEVPESEPKVNGAAEHASYAPPEASDIHDGMRDTIFEMIEATTDESAKDVLFRALGIYRTIVRHVKSGGTVKFVDADGTKSKTLKVPVRRSP